MAADPQKNRRRAEDQMAIFRQAHSVQFFLSLLQRIYTEIKNAQLTNKKKRVMRYVRYVVLLAHLDQCVRTPNKFTTQKKVRDFLTPGVIGQLVVHFSLGKNKKVCSCLSTYNNNRIDRTRSKKSKK